MMKFSGHVQRWDAAVERCVVKLWGAGRWGGAVDWWWCGGLARCGLVRWTSAVIVWDTV